MTLFTGNVLSNFCKILYKILFDFCLEEALS